MCFIEKNLNETMKILMIFFIQLYLYGTNAKGSSEFRDYFIVISDLKNHEQAVSALTIVLERISLKRFHVGLFATSGFYQSALQFKSKSCLVESFQSNKRAKDCSSETCSLQSIVSFARTYTSDKLHDKSLKSFLILTDSYKNIDGIGFEANETVLVAAGADVTNDSYYRTFKETSEKLTRCTVGKDRYIDECGQECICVNGKLKKCQRVREEFSSMSFEKRKQYINAYLKVASNIVYRKRFEELVTHHLHAFYRGLHEDKSQFFPWHRSYLLEYENILRTVDCSATIPYWNWAKFSANPWAVTSKYHMWSADSGFGGNGASRKGYCVIDGPFNENYFKVAKIMKNFNSFSHFSNVCCEKFVRSGFYCPKSKFFLRNENWIKRYIKCKTNTMMKGKKHCLKRSFGWFPPTLDIVKKVVHNLTVDKLDEFSLIIMFHFHDRIHLNVGGHMRTEYSSAAPEFWLHHSFLDAIWDRYQQKGYGYKFANLTKYGNDYSLLSFKPLQKGKWYIDNDNLGGCNIRVKYSDIFEDSTRRTKEGKKSLGKCLPCYKYRPKETSSFELLQLAKKKPYLFDDDFTLDCW